MSRKQASSETCNRPFASRLSAVMDERGITQKQLAEVIGKKPQTVSLYRLGQSEPDASTILKIADYLNVTVDWLIGRDNAPIIYGSTVSEAAAVLGMTDKAANQLKEISGISDIAASAMDDFIKSPHFQKIVKLIIAYLKEMQGFVSLANNPASEPSDIYEIISAYDLCEYYASKEIGTLFTEIKKREISKCTSLKIEDDGRISYHEEWRQDSNAKH